MGEDVDQDNKQQNPEEEPTTEENQPTEEQQSQDSAQPEEESSTESNEPENSAAEQPDDAAEEDAPVEADDNDNHSSEEENTPEGEPEKTEESIDSSSEDEPEPTEPIAEEEQSHEVEPVPGLEEPSTETESEQQPAEPEAPGNTEEAEDELIAGMPPDTMVEAEKTDTDVAAMEAEGSHEEHTISTDSNSHHAPVVVIVALLVGLLMVAVAFMAYQSTNNESVEETASQADYENTEEVVAEREELYKVQTKLEDVTPAATATGEVSAQYYDDNAYELVANFTNLPDRANGEFFEGWLVNLATGKFVSTGAVEYTSSGLAVNNFVGAQDYQTLGYTSYVLTLEPNDDDPAPAIHILEGTLETVN